MDLKYKYFSCEARHLQAMRSTAPAIQTKNKYFKQLHGYAHKNTDLFSLKHCLAAHHPKQNATLSDVVQENIEAKCIHVFIQNKLS